MTVTRPMLRYFGGKWHAAPWILGHFPAHRCYVEAFGGAASVLLRKPRSEVEVLNDVNRDLYDLYRVVRCPRRAYDLEIQLSLTPFSRAEHDAAYVVDIKDDRVEIARKAIVRGAMAFGTGTDGGVLGRRAGFRDTTSPLGRTTLPVDDWSGYPDALAGMTARLRGVIVDCRDAIEVMRRHDRPNTLHYVDPPYVHATRGRDLRGYVHELDDAGHVRLLECLIALKGAVVLSGYQCALYDEALAGWKRVERRFVDQGRRARVECLWLSPAAVERVPQRDLLERLNRHVL